MTTTIQPKSKFITVNSLRLHHLDWGNEKAPPVVLVHGYTGNAHSFDPLARQLRDRFHIVAADVRGHGDSAWSPNGDYGYAECANDLAGVVQELGLTRFGLVGTSMGGIIAMTYAGIHPEKLERLVINDIGPDQEQGSSRITQMVGARPETFSSLEEAVTYQLAAMPASRLAQLSRAEQWDLASHTFRQLPNGPWTWKHDLALVRQRVQSGPPARPPLWPVLQRLQCPSLVVWGVESDVLSEQQAHRMVATLPEGQLLPVPKVGHAPTLMEPSVLPVIERFLSRAPSKQVEEKRVSRPA